ncbi:efflux RND transporter periplasmic adaptor subunit [Patescibacteria group bacterium]|nr:efflux RND transporter periplasmic adaptor subunit [Patescibacteria group bacterium]
MNNILKLNSVQSRIQKIKDLRRNQQILIVLILIILGFVVYQQFIIKDIIKEDTVVSNARQVEIMSVEDLSLDNTPLPLLGKVQSQSSAIVHAQSAGEITALYKKEGDSVWANQVIAEIDNWAQRSSLIQAEASVESATAYLNKIKTGARDEQVSILKSTLDNSENALNETKVSVINTLNDAYIKADDAIRNKTDIMFRDPRGSDPQITFPVNDSQLEIDIEWERFLIEQMLEKWGDSLFILETEDDLIEALEIAKENIDQIRKFLDNIALAVNVLTPTTNLSELTISTWKAGVSSTRSIINMTASAIPGTVNSLNSVISANEIAQLNYNQILTGERTEDIIGAEAQLRQAEGGLDLAKAALEKTIVRAPISGTINSLNFKKGDFVSNFEPIVTIANNNKLEVVSYITEIDRESINTGASVLINKKWKGSVKNIAPALDSKTKKIKVEIEVDDKSAVLTNGQSVSLLIERISKKDTGELVEFSVPISAVKIGADSVVVFTVNEENKLVAHPVILGPILGEKIIIEEGLVGEMEIVIDARGLKEGETVESLKFIKSIK